MRHASERVTARTSRRADTVGRATSSPLGILALQRSAGNKAIGQVVAREAATKGIVKIGKLAVRVAGGNLATWAAGEVPDSLVVTSQKGAHSAALKRFAAQKTKIGSLSVSLAPPNQKGQQLDLGSLVIGISNGRILAYDVAGSTESWSVGGFDRVNRTKTTHKVS